MFVPYTWDGGLVKELREVEAKMGPMTCWRIKFVERAGVKMVDMLHKADPWEAADCERERCKLCKTKQKTGKNTSQSCTKRSIIDETSCATCVTREEEKIDSMEKTKLKANIK